MSTSEQIAADYQSSVPNTNSLSERLSAAHKRNVERVQATAVAADCPVHAAPPQRMTAKQYAYESGVKLLEPLVNRVEELEAQLEWVKVELVRLSAPKV